jgi:hypothetical protein
MRQRRFHRAIVAVAASLTAIYWYIDGVDGSIPK